MRIRCRWCFDRLDGCVACPPLPEPISVAHLDNPEEMETLRRGFGREALDQAFGPNGRGMAEIRGRLGGTGR